MHLIVPVQWHGIGRITVDGYNVACLLKVNFGYVRLEGIHVGYPKRGYQWYGCTAIRCGIGKAPDSGVVAGMLTDSDCPA